MSAHQTEINPSGGSRCTACLREFQKAPWGDCPGVPQYDWNPWPDGLYTAKQLAQERLTPGPIAGALYYRRAAGYWLWLYRKEDAVAKPPLSEKRRAGIERAQATRRRNRTCRRCGTYVPSNRAEEWIDAQGHCRPCGVRFWARELLRAGFVVVDLETTGLDTEAEIVQIGVTDHHGAVLLDTYVRPQQPIVEREYEDGSDQDNWDEPRRTAFGVNGITNAMVSDAPDFPGIYPRLQQLLAGRHVVAYNREFEGRQLGAHQERYGLPKLAALAWLCAMEAFATFYGDYSRKYGDFKYKSLGFACAELGVAQGPNHQAAADCLATVALLRALAQEPQKDGTE